MVLARGVVFRDRKCNVSSRLEMMPESSERRDGMSYRRIRQAGLEDLSSFFVTAKSYIE